ncbi:thiolase family protein [Pararcticibacter amylolyticus]|uniref:acetyl-CoA C-acetyltransferase n=1 Tax=Pararcticibacter amylolyticus TaxID=2173175 RepID=A0A2U2PFQ7_9SPHI|nr:thiolase family protein [Pararcticibacter amylolyticus]PWG80226.1 acetyl-CoA C-acetyltransferase [Pararcticibacter amylolyticus]
MNDVWILSACRTPLGSYGGALSALSAVELGAFAISGAVKKSRNKLSGFGAVVMGNVLSANLGQNPARQAAMFAGLPAGICATTVNKVCSSGMKAVSMISQDIRLGEISAGLAGGMESMSQVPFYIPGVRRGLGYGNKSLVDGISRDGLTDAFSQESMGVYGDQMAVRYDISRKDADDYTEHSYQRCSNAWESGMFTEEIIPVKVESGKGESRTVHEDEEFRRMNFEKLRRLRPAFSKDGCLTAASSSPLSDGAAALVLASPDYATGKGLRPLARILAYAEAEQEPEHFISSPAHAARKALGRAGLTTADIDVFEINEAFAIVPLVFCMEMQIPVSKLNLFGGAVSIGHPLGASGARILCTLISVLRACKGRYGLAAICNGGGGASAMIIENLQTDY